MYEYVPFGSFPSVMRSKPRTEANVSAYSSHVWDLLNKTKIFIEIIKYMCSG